MFRLLVRNGKLRLVEKNVKPLCFTRYFRIKIFRKIVDISELRVSVVVQSDFYYILLIRTLRNKIIVKKFEQQKAFAGSAKPGYYLYRAVSPFLYQFV